MMTAAAIEDVLGERLRIVRPRPWREDRQKHESDSRAYKVAIRCVAVPWQCCKRSLYISCSAVGAVFSSLNHGLPARSRLTHERPRAKNGPEALSLPRATPFLTIGDGDIVRISGLFLTGVIAGIAVYAMDAAIDRRDSG
jgi:hypothetical protein